MVVTGDVGLEAGREKRHTCLERHAPDPDTCQEGQMYHRFEIKEGGKKGFRVWIRA